MEQMLVERTRRAVCSRMIEKAIRRLEAANEMEEPGSEAQEVRRQAIASIRSLEKEATWIS